MHLLRYRTAGAVYAAAAAEAAPAALAQAQESKSGRCEFFLRRRSVQPAHIEHTCDVNCDTCVNMSGGVCASRVEAVGRAN